MRRMFSVAVLSALMVSFTPAFAQRAGHAGGFSGGHASGGAGHSFGGGFAGSRSAGRSSVAAPRSFAVPSRMTSTAPARSFASRYRLPATPASRRGDGRGEYRYRSPYRGYGYVGYPYLNSWQLLPWDLGYPDVAGTTAYDSAGDATPDTGAYAQQPDEGYRPDYGQPSYESSVNTTMPEPQLTLIFKDGHQQTIRNYVLTHSEVIVVDQAASGRQQQIPLASLDVSATEEAAQQAGLDFSPPA